MKQPAYLKSGDKIGIVSIARKVQPADIKRAIEIFESWGITVVLGENIFAADNQFGGTDEQRAADLQNMLNDPEIKAVISTRGGYGTSRIIDKINFDSLLTHPKWLIGFSDITLLHQHINKSGLATLHATMPVLFEKPEAGLSVETLKKALFAESYSIEAKPHYLNRSGEANATVIGGNLSLLVHAIGTPSEIDYRDKILFIEDLDEYLYHIDRMMIQLKRAGKLKNLAGLVVGHLSDMRDNQIPFGKSVVEIIAEHVSEYHFPVAFNFPAGHEHPNHCIPFGVNSKLLVINQQNSELHFSFNVIL